jgi:hypothetical protein
MGRGLRKALRHCPGGGDQRCDSAEVADVVKGTNWNSQSDNLSFMDGMVGSGRQITFRGAFRSCLSKASDHPGPSMARAIIFPILNIIRLGACR